LTLTRVKFLPYSFEHAVLLFNDRLTLTILIHVIFMFFFYDWTLFKFLWFVIGFSHATLGLYKKLLNRAPKALNRYYTCCSKWHSLMVMLFCSSLFSFVPLLLQFQIFCKYAGGRCVLSQRWSWKLKVRRICLFCKSVCQFFFCVTSVNFIKLILWDHFCFLLFQGKIVDSII